MSTDSVKIYAMVVAVTERAVLLRIRAVNKRDLEPQPDEWIPKSQIIECCSEVSDLSRDEVIEAEIPGWLAMERKLYDD